MSDFDYSRVVYDADGALRTADVLAFAPGVAGWDVLLITRGSPPFLDQYAAPGGFLENAKDSGPGAAAVRELQEETGLIVEPPSVADEERVPENLVTGRLAWLGKWNAAGRDPRFQTATDVYVVVLDSRPEVFGGDDAAAAEFVNFYDLVRRIEDGEMVLAFDHDQYITAAAALLEKHGVA